MAAIAEVAETERLLVATDFDGCLAPIVDDPATARPLPESMEALRSLTVTPGTVVAVVSGRALADLRNLLGDRSTGSTWSAATAPRSPAIAGRSAASTPRTQDQLDRRPGGAAGQTATPRSTASRHGPRGVHLEIKPTGIAVHLRSASHRRRRGGRRRAAMPAPATWPG